MGGTTHYFRVTEGFRAELDFPHKTLYPPGPCPYPVPTPHGAHTCTDVFSDLHVPFYRLHLCALSSSGPCVFPGTVLSCSPFCDRKWAEQDLAVDSCCLYSLWDWLTGEMFRR